MTAPHALPTDADLSPVLGRFDEPARAGIGCGRGWYPIILRLDAQIAQIAPDYRLQQVKEKFGTLRYYWAFPPIELACCTEWNQRNPRPGVAGAASPEEANSWLERHEGHAAGQRHGEQLRGVEAEKARRKEQHALIERLVRQAELESARTCEDCGDSGELDPSRRWVKTLCGSCRELLQGQFEGGTTSDGQ